MRKLVAGLVLVLGIVVGGTAMAEEARITHGGLTLNGRLELASGKALGDGVVLLVHGTLAHNGMETIATLTDLLVQRGLNVLAINLSLGVDDRHGMYDCTVPHRHRHGDAPAEIGAWMAWLKERGAGPVVLMGHSRGGNQAAWHAAEGKGAMPARLVLLAPATDSRAKTEAAYRQRFGEPLAAGLARWEALAAAGKGGELLKVPGFLYCPDAMVTPDAFLDYHRDDPRRDTPYLLAGIAVPTLVIAGSEDKVVEGLPDRMAEVRNPKVRLKVVDGADHFFRDLFADEVADLTADFIAGKE